METNEPKVFKFSKENGVKVSKIMSTKLKNLKGNQLGLNREQWKTSIHD